MYSLLLRFNVSFRHSAPQFSVSFANPPTSSPVSERSSSKKSTKSSTPKPSPSPVALDSKEKDKHRHLHKDRKETKDVEPRGDPTQRKTEWQAPQMQLPPFPSVLREPKHTFDDFGGYDEQKEVS